MIGAEGQCDLHIHHCVAGYNTGGYRVAAAFFHGRNIFFRYDTACSFIFKNKTASRFAFFQSQYNMSELAATTGLTDKAFFNFSRSVQGFTVGNHWFPNIAFHSEFPAHSVDENLQMKLTHAGNDGLACLFIDTDLKSRIFFSQLADGP